MKAGGAIQAALGLPQPCTWLAEPHLTLPYSSKKRGKINKNYRKLNSPEQPLAVELGSCGGPSHVQSCVREDGRLVSPKPERLRKLQEATTPLLPKSAKHQRSQLGLSWQSTSGSSSISSRSRSGWSRCSSSRRRRHRRRRAM